MFVNGKRGKEVMIDHVTIFAGKQHILFRPKGIYLQINRQKKNEKKKPDPASTPSQRFTDTQTKPFERLPPPIPPPTHCMPECKQVLHNLGNRK